MPEADPFPDHEHRNVDYPCGCSWENYSPDGQKWEGWRGYLCSEHASEYSELSFDMGVVFLKPPPRKPVWEGGFLGPILRPSRRNRDG